MKGILLIFTLFIASIVFSQETECRIYFKDGTEKKGYLEKGSFPFPSKISLTDKIEFIEDKNVHELTEFEYTTILKIDVKEKGKLKRTRYFKNLKEDPETIIPLSLILKGKVSFYKFLGIKDKFTPNVGNVTSNSTGVMPNGGGESLIKEYYFQKEEGDLVKVYTLELFGKTYKKILKQFFEDCPKLLDLIEKQAFKKYVRNTPKLAKKHVRNRFIEIVKYYNSKCQLEN